MIFRPAILFLDEPTSGLDAFQSQSVMECMKNMADSGRLVISVIHQPRSSIYNMFDQLLLLSMGRVMYMGPVKQAVPYFESIGFSCPRSFNPSDYFLDILSPDNRSPEADEKSMKQIEVIGNAWQEHLTNGAANGNNSTESAEAMQPVVLTWEEYWSRFSKNFSLLYSRAFTEQRRDLPTLGIKCFFTLFFGAILGGIYSKDGHDQKGIHNITGLLFVITSKYP
jgi:ABC-type multidrug transport system ATPase subunit